MRTIDAGSKYPVALRDADGEFLDGSNTYKLHIPQRPARRALLGGDGLQHHRRHDGRGSPQLMPSDQRDEPRCKANDDGSVDHLLRLQPKPAGVRMPIGSKPYQRPDFLVTIRLYGTGVEFYDQTWKPDDVVKIK
ncbi:MAG: DUF1214 domain-containing protein [Nitrospira sp.]